jgi:2'-5' RNA ligase
MTQSVELLLDDELDAAVRAQWATLVAAGLPSQARHTGETNRPHVTLTVASSVQPYIEIALKSALTGRLPLSVQLGGLLCFAGRDGRLVLTRSVVPTIELLELQAVAADLFGAQPGTSPQLEPGQWSPHVTLARKMTAEQVGSALAVLGESPTLTGTAVGIRRWDSDARTAWQIAH